MKPASFVVNYDYVFVVVFNKYNLFERLIFCTDMLCFEKIKNKC